MSGVRKSLTSVIIQVGVCVSGKEGGQEFEWEKTCVLGGGVEGNDIGEDRDQMVARQGPEHPG